MHICMHIFTFLVCRGTLGSPQLVEQVFFRDKNEWNKKLPKLPIRASVDALCRDGADITCV